MAYRFSTILVFWFSLPQNKAVSNIFHTYHIPDCHSLQWWFFQIAGKILQIKISPPRKKKKNIVTDTLNNLIVLAVYVDKSLVVQICLLYKSFLKVCKSGFLFLLVSILLFLNLFLKIPHIIFFTATKFIFSLCR
jgi:hypothetical protein